MMFRREQPCPRLYILQLPRKRTIRSPDLLPCPPSGVSYLLIGHNRQLNGRSFGVRRRERASRHKGASERRTPYTVPSVRAYVVVVLGFRSIGLAAVGASFVLSLKTTGCAQPGEVRDPDGGAKEGVWCGAANAVQIR